MELSEGEAILDSSLKRSSASGLLWEAPPLVSSPATGFFHTFVNSSYKSMGVHSSDPDGPNHTQYGGGQYSQDSEDDLADAGQSSDFIVNNDLQGDPHVNSSESSSSDSDLDFFIYKEIKKGVAHSVKKRLEAKLGNKTRSKMSRHTSKSAKSRKSRRSINSFSRCNLSLFAGVVSALTDNQKELIKSKGFDCLLLFENCSLPRSFVQFIAGHVDLQSSEIVLNGKAIQINSKAVHMVLGIPFGGSEVTEDKATARNVMLKFFGQSTIPPIKFFAKKLAEPDLPGDTFFLCFMVVALSAFLCPNSSTYPSPRYLSPFLDLNSVKCYDWSKFVFDWLFEHLNKYTKSLKNITKERKTLGGCIYFLAVHYLDYLDFGPQALPNSFPRTTVWKGDLIKDYAKLDCVSRHNYGRRPINDFAQTCYGSWPPDNSDPPAHQLSKIDQFKIALDAAVNNMLSIDEKDNIVNMFSTSQQVQSDDSSLNAQNFALQVLTYVLSLSSEYTSSHHNDSTPEWSNENSLHTNMPPSLPRSHAFGDSKGFVNDNREHEQYSGSTVKISSSGGVNGESVDMSQTTIKVSSSDCSPVKNSQSTGSKITRKRKAEYVSEHSSSPLSGNSTRTRASQRPFIPELSPLSKLRTATKRASVSKDDSIPSVPDSKPVPANVIKTASFDYLLHNNDTTTSPPSSNNCEYENKKQVYPTDEDVSNTKDSSHAIDSLQCNASPEHTIASSAVAALSTPGAPFKNCRPAQEDSSSVPVGAKTAIPCDFSGSTNKRKRSKSWDNTYLALDCLTLWMTMGSILKMKGAADLLVNHVMVKTPKKIFVLENLSPIILIKTTYMNKLLTNPYVILTQIPITIYIHPKIVFSQAVLQLQISWIHHLQPMLINQLVLS